MKRALLALTICLCTTALYAQSLDPNAGLKNYVSKVLPQCPGGTLTLEALGAPVPANFNAYAVTLRSSDQYCGTKRYVLYSPKSKQVLVGSVIPLKADKRPSDVRIAEEAGRLLGKQVTATVAPFPLADGIKAVSVNRATPYGSFAYSGYLDASEQFLIIGYRGILTTDPTKTIRETLGTASAARRGNAASKVEILEISDFQCPTCARAHAKMEPFIQENLSRINYIRLDLPLFENHQWALPAAMGARALQKVAPDKYWAYVDYIFKNQEAIGSRKIDDVVREWMEDNDVAWSAIQKIYASKAERQALLEQVSRAYAVGVASTPTFLVNGQILGFGPDGNFTMDAIRKAIGTQPAAAAKKPAK